MRDAKIEILELMYKKSLEEIRDLHGIIYHQDEIIESQKAEIERFEKENNEKFNKWKILDNRTKQRYAELYEEAKAVVRAEAIKEVAKFLIDNCKNGIIAIDDLCDYVKEETDFNPYDFSKMFLNCGELKPINTEIAGESND